MKILVLGSTGFVGRNLCDILASQHKIIKTSRNQSDSSFINFDLLEIDSWQKVIDTNPDVIINAAAYGVVKNELDLEMMYNINYFRIIDFYDALKRKLNFFWVQLGTAFEYDLSKVGGLTERSPCLPRTHYGISKLMFSNFLLENAPQNQFSIFRPFGMFGKYEDKTKFFPMLIRAQRTGEAVQLSAGNQQRDYFYIQDFCTFIGKIIHENKLSALPNILNLGSGETKSFREYAEILSTVIPHFDESNWQWGKIPLRANESLKFYNSSTQARSLGFKPSGLQQSFLEIIDYYYSIQ